MGTRWKRFRYGTEEVNPTWSFYASILFLGITLIFCELAEHNYDLSNWAYSICFGVLALVSLWHLNVTVSNEKMCAFPITILDGKCPDLLLAVIIGAACLIGKDIWQIYHMALGEILDLWNYEENILSIIILLFLVITPITFAVFLLMSFTRHLFKKKLEQTLFFVRLYHWSQELGRKLLRRWEIYLEEKARRGHTAKIWFHRRRWMLGVQFFLTLAAFFYLSNIYLLEIDGFFIFLVLMGIILLDIWIEARTAKDMGIILNEIEQMVQNCSVKETPVLSSHSLFRVTEEELLAIQKIQKESVEKRLQSERMKVELITNVSHDLKTPLTSMIGCIDLLEQTKGLPEEAMDYVKLLSIKAGRLREMIQDVFEMSKAAVNQDLNMEKLDMTRLIRQTVADMRERMDESGLLFRIRIEERELPFMGDGKKLYRVYQNLIENTLKYSMAGSRVYIEVQEKEGHIITSVKNTSSYEMDFKADEIIERFTRGDKSRSTEGNGLGLAIAKSFTEACGGSFRLTLDGDLFKVETEFEVLDFTDGRNF